MRSLEEYILESKRSMGQVQFKCHVTNEIIPDESVIEYCVSDKNGLVELFERMNNDEFGNPEEYIVCLAVWGLGNALIVETDMPMKFNETPDGGVIVNVDDDRDAYDANTINNSSDYDGIVIFDEKTFMSWR